MTLKFSSSSGASSNINPDSAVTLQCVVNNAPIPAGSTVLSAHVLWKMVAEVLGQDPWSGPPPDPSGWGKWLTTLSGSMALSTNGSTFTTILANNPINVPTSYIFGPTYDYPNTHGGGYYYPGGSPAQTYFGVLIPMTAPDSAELRALLSSNYSTYYVRATISSGLADLASQGNRYSYVTVYQPRAELYMVLA